MGSRLPRAAVGNRCHTAVTLLEVVLAMGLLMILSSMTYWFYSSGLASRDRGTAEADKLRLARVVLDRLAVEIRQANFLTGDEKIGIVGDKEQILISTLRVPTKETTRKRGTREGPPSPELDTVQVEYRIARHPQILHEDGYEAALGLARVEKLVPRQVATTAISKKKDTQDAKPKEEPPPDAPPPSVGDLLTDPKEDANRQALGLDINWEELYAPEVRFVRFCYYDGFKWWDDWQVMAENPLPQLVMVTIGFDGHPPCGEEFGQDRDNEEFCTCLNKDPVDCKPLSPDQFSTVVRVVGADPLFRSRVSREGQDFVQKQVDKGKAEKGDEEGSGQ